MSPNYSESAAAKVLGISRVTLLRMRKRGQIGFFRIGWRVVYSADHIQEFLDRCERHPSSGSVGSK